MDFYKTLGFGVSDVPAATDGAIYIGHIGEHLPSGSTEKVRR